MIYLLLTVAAVLPAVLLVWYFHARDTFPEPPRVLWTTFALGCLSVIPAVVLGVVLEPLLEPSHVLTSAAFEAFVIAALCEEACKLAVLLGYSFRHSAFDEAMDGIVYGATASLGFAALENIMYVLDGGFGLAVLRGLLSVPGHAAYGAVMGYYVGRARVDREHRWLLVGRGLLAAIVMHGLYDLPLMLAGADAVAGPPPAPDAAGVNPVVFGVLVLLWFATVIGGWLWTLRLVRHTRHAQAPHASHAPSARPLEPMVSPGGAQAVVPMPTVDAGPTMAADASERDSVSAPALSSVSVPASAWPPVAVSASASTPVAVPARSAPGGWARFAAWAGVVGGGTIASAGFLFSALAAVSAASGDVPRENVPYLAIGVLAIGVVPGLIGFAAFALGVRRLNRAR